MERHYEMTVTSETDSIEAFSLVAAPAIGVEWVTLSKQQQNLAAVAKKQMITGPVLIPDLVIPRVDQQGKYTIQFSCDTIEKLQMQTMQQLYTQSSVTNIEHNPLSKIDQKRVYLVESWIKTTEQDKSNQYWPDLPIGTWFVTLKVLDTELWSMIEAGKMKGFSIESLLETVPVKTPVKMSEQTELWQGLTGFLSRRHKV